MSKQYFKVLSSATLKDAIKCMHDSQQNCVLVVDKEDFLEGILTYGDIRRCLSQESTDPLKGDLVVLDVCRKCPCSLYFRDPCLFAKCFPNSSFSMFYNSWKRKTIVGKNCFLNTF